jgi:uncharacterized protein YndB with AHSA1/START domain
VVKKIGIIIGVLIVVLLGVASMRPAHFRVERSGVLKASPEKIFPYLSDFKLGEQWSPFGSQKDPQIKEEVTGQPATVGTKMKFEGNSDVGAGELEFLKVIPQQSVQLKLTMTKPFRAENTIDYVLTPQADGTLFTWTMSGENNLIGKVIGLFINCDKMIGDEFEKGITNLKIIVEKGDSK